MQKCSKNIIKPLEEILADKLEEKEFNDRDDLDFTSSSGTYHPDFCKAVWTLQNFCVSLDAILPAMDAVFKLVGKRLLRKPARTTLIDMGAARLTALNGTLAR